MIAAVLLAAAAAFLFINIRVKTAIGIENTRADICLSLMLLFGLLPIRFFAAVTLDIPGGISVSVNGRPPKPLSELKKRGKNMPLAAVRGALRVKSLDFSGRAGVADMPDKSVLIAGGLNSLCTQISLAFSERPRRADIAPSFDEAGLALNVEGILSVNPGKLLLGIIKNRRRRK